MLSRLGKGLHKYLTEDVGVWKKYPSVKNLLYENSHKPTDTHFVPPAPPPVLEQTVSLCFHDLVVHTSLCVIKEALLSSLTILGQYKRQFLPFPNVSTFP